MAHPSTTNPLMDLLKELILGTVPSDRQIFNVTSPTALANLVETPLKAPGTGIGAADQVSPRTTKRSLMLCSSHVYIVTNQP